LKYEGLSYTEIWISEAQERMILAVPPEAWPALQKLLAGEDVEGTVIGRFEPTGRLRLLYQGNQVGDLDMRFLHHGRPPVVRRATWRAGGVGLPWTESGEGSNSEHARHSVHGGLTPPARPRDLNEVLLKILSSYSVCSKEWIVRQ